MGHDVAYLASSEGNPESDGSSRHHEGKIDVNRIIRSSVLGAALAVATIGASAVAAVPAYADGATPTSLTVTGSRTTVPTGTGVSVLPLS